MKFFNLEQLRSIIENATGLGISYAYEDLVFPDHTVFLIEFDSDQENHFNCYFREDCLEDEKESLFMKLEKECKKNLCNITDAGRFRLEQLENRVKINFLTEDYYEEQRT